MAEIIQTTCECGEQISIELNCKRAARKDGKRPFYPDENVEPWSVVKDDERIHYSQSGVTTFRCRRCGGWLGDTVSEAKFEISDRGLNHG
ncbi:hypothetical protein AAHD90_03250 [Citrobacter portucalensis]|uniref:Uncharacterized protein n=1 Tax=Citrobacter portucalensis TaxID=1639133 RepID=A0ABZ0H5R5_9ENTR|nr:hypothetical protein [Citrobacter portucalensis]MDE9663549.1 hypothetical protein [Citrobacter portucalensis]MDE9672645.1 hypothetical protein [Citrobacter portucalensis]MEB2744541.1 hypothetical protein [Citrobacter portucalensis]WOH45282.1 hypothetical protein RY846_09000 [Citrobacter portucalensis]WOH45635.1 hypothetical protein RY846_10950 [Citrobacter portucalensis]